MSSRARLPASTTWRDIPSTVLTLGLVSLLMDISSELIHALLPVFLATVVGASTVTIGLIEGVSEATAAITKVFSGALSDRIGKRKLLVAIGYGLAALTKPVFPLASTSWQILAARFVDRIGKGIREAPRDALIADVTPEGIRGASYGLRQALDTIGAFAGPLLAVALMALYADDFRAVFWWSALPATLAVLLILFGLREPAQTAPAARRDWPVHARELRRLPSAYWIVVATGAVFALARFSEAFLVLKAQADGLALALIPLVYVLMNLIYAGVAMPAGILSDRIGRNNVLTCGLVVLTAADLTLAFVPGLIGTAIGVALWGLYLGLSQGLLSAMVADTAPPDLRGTAFGLFNLVTGAALLIASLLAGSLWHAYGSQATFTTGAAFSIATVLLMLTALRSRPDRAV
ncbi:MULTISPECIES: MFS transporter [unclassified Bradyrhizobium]|uniref:MFS transporter n=1 Tax=unclassified Bradyrhizobium TaxID=2631580 RepID=UPI002915DD2E|nr:MULTISPECIES: MFS transporter [unclassified Bradyrhizobium]